MAYSEADYDYDVFISYAHGDKLEGHGTNWVVKFKRLLTFEINSRSGTKYNRVYFDEDTQTYNERVKSILDKVTRSKVLLIIGSPNFVNSKWCLDEVATFHDHHGDESRMFVAEMMGLRGGSYPSEVSALLQARFWEKDDSGTPMTLTSGDKEYKKLLGRMAQQICNALDGLETKPRPIVLDPPDPPGTGPDTIGMPPPPRAPRPLAAVVAYAPDEVGEDRDSLIGYLADLHVPVVELPPEMPRRSPDLEAALADALGRASIYVQLLGRRKGRVLEEGAESPTELQHRAAVAQLDAEDIFLWRPDDIDPERNPDESYKQLLRRAENPSVPELAEAIQTRLKALEKLREPLPYPADVPVVLINADPEDEDFADLLMQACRGRRCEAMIDNCDLNDERRAQWADATAVAFVQARADRGWLMARYRIFKRDRANSGASSALQGQAVVYGPPPPKRLGTIVAPNLVEIDASSPKFDAVQFESWLDRIGAVRETA